MSTDLSTLHPSAVDHHGVVTGSAAVALGVPAAQLLALVRREVLEHVAGDVYRLRDAVTPLTEYAEAVALAGPGAVLADDEVLALHDLALMDPRRIRVAVAAPLPTGAALPDTVEIVIRPLTSGDVTDVEGIPTMTVAAALRACRYRVPTGRLLNGVERAVEEGLIDTATAQSLRAEFTPPTGTLEDLMDELEQSRQPRAVLRSADWLSLTELAARRGETDMAAVGGWVYQQLRQRALIALETPDGTIAVPAFQVTATGQPRPELRPLLAVLFGARLGGWAAWAWLTSPSSFLTGEVPEQVAASDPGRALRAATAFVTAADV